MNKINIDGTHNMRYIANYPGMDGKKTSKQFIRSDSLHDITEDGLQKLKNLNVRCIIDLRSRVERDKSPFPYHDDKEIEYVSVPMLDQFTDIGNISAIKLPSGMFEVYKGILENQKPQVAKVFQAIARHSQDTVLYHCAGGKDRTGIISMLLLKMAGVPEDIVISDYAESEENMKDVYRKQQEDMHNILHVTPPEYMFFSRPEVMRETLEYFDSVYESVEDYLRSAQVSEGEIATVKAMLFEK